jgi:hypothetical protein
MVIRDFEAWRAELFEAGDLPQDVPDDPEAEEEAEEQADRYRELVKDVTGREDVDVVIALIASMRAEEDEGAYDDTIETLEIFPDLVLGRGAGLAWETLLSIPKKFSGEVLYECCHRGAESIGAFNEIYASLQPEAQRLLGALINHHETSTWLSGPECGLLRPVRDAFEAFFDSL